MKMMSGLTTWEDDVPRIDFKITEWPVKYKINNYFYHYYLLNILDILCLGKHSRQWSWRRRNCDSATMQCMYVLECQLQTVGTTFYDPMHVVCIPHIARWVRQYRGKTWRRNGVCFQIDDNISKSQIYWIAITLSPYLLNIFVTMVRAWQKYWWSIDATRHGKAKAIDHQAERLRSVRFTTSCKKKTQRI